MIKYVPKNEEYEYLCVIAVCCCNFPKSKSNKKIFIEKVLEVIDLSKINIGNFYLNCLKINENLIRFIKNPLLKNN